MTEKTVKENNYEQISRPYNDYMQRSQPSEIPTSVDAGSGENIDMLKPVKSGQALNDVQITTTIKSENYRPRTSGFLIDGLTGLIECMKLVAPLGEIGGWRLTPTTIESSGLILDSANSTIKSNPFSSGAQGFSIDPSTAEFNNIIARGLIKTSTFEKDTVSSVGGSMVISKGSDILDADMTAADNSTLTIKGAETFSINDILRIKEGISLDEWFKVTNVSAAPTYVVERDKASQYGTNTNPAWKAGATVVNYGQSGQGIVEIAASGTNMPWIKVNTHTGTPWASLDTKVIVGQLKDKTGSDSYGIWTDNGFFTGAITGGTLDIPNATSPLFRVDTNGNMTATSAKFFEQFTAGENIADGDVVCVKSLASSSPFWPVEDTYVDQFNPTLNFGSEMTMRLGQNISAGTFIQVPLIKFDLSGSGSPGDTVSASLTLKKESSNNNDIICSLYAITSDWVEGTVTWNTRPTFTSLITSITSTPSDTELVFDITSTVQSVQAGATIYGFAVVPGGISGSDSMTIHSRETSPSLRPQITIIGNNYSDGKVYRASSDSFLLCRSVVGIAQESKNTDQLIKIQTAGKITNLSGSLPNTGGTVFLGGAYGTVTPSTINLARIISLGDVLSSGTFLLNIKSERLLISIGVMSSSPGIFYAPNSARLAVVDIEYNSGNISSRQVISAYRDTAGLPTVAIVDNGGAAGGTASFAVGWGTDYIATQSGGGYTIHGVYFYT